MKHEFVKANAEKKVKQFKSTVQSKIQLDAEAAKIFEVVEMGDGDESMAIKPWMGAIKEPKEHNPVNPEKPDHRFEIDFVYGYKSEEVRQNLFYNSKRRPVYMTAALGIIFDPGNRKQLFFGGGETNYLVRKQTDVETEGHTDDIMCLTMNNTRTIVASGQVGNIPIIYVWDALTAKALKCLKLPKGSKSVTAISFNRSSDLIACADFSNDHNLYCFDWQKSQLIIQVKTGPNKIFMIDWNLASDTQFVTVGPKHIQFWNLDQKMGSTLKPKGGVFGSFEQTNMLCVTHDLNGVAYTGAQNGMIYKWQNGSLKTSDQIHKGVIHCIRYLKDCYQ